MSPSPVAGTKSRPIVGVRGALNLNPHPEGLPPAHYPGDAPGVRPVDKPDADISNQPSRVEDARAIAGDEAGAVASGAIIAIDVAERMCQLIRNRIKRDDSSAVVRGDARGLPFDTDSFDAVPVSFTLELFEERDQMGVLGGDSSRTRPGGKNLCHCPLDSGERRHFSPP